MSGDSFGSDSRFLVRTRLGAGASGEVFRVFDGRFRQEVALKTLFRAEPAAVLRFKNEFRSLADVVHPNLAQLYELHTDGQTWFFTMELVPGVDFYDWVRGQDEEAAALPAPPPDEGRLRSALLQLADGLAALHRAGKLHCDLKPSNLRVTPVGRVVLLDFGLVREIAPPGEQPEEVAGTPSYMSPEQMSGLPFSTASDWYAVGVLLFEALTGTLPYEGSFLDILKAKMLGDPPSPATRVANLPPDLAQLCLELLAHEPEERPDGAEVLRRLGSRAEASGQVAAPSQAAPLFVGREPQLALLEAAFAKSREGRSSLVWVHGSSGMGKSALVQHFVATARERHPDLLCLEGRCYERESVPYKALDALLDALARHLRSLSSGAAAELLPRDIQALARLFPVLQSVEPIAHAPRQVLAIPDERELRRRAYASLREVLHRIARRRPLILVIDDLQWGDRDSAGLIAELLGPPVAPPCLLLGCFRSEERGSSPLLAALAESGQLVADAEIAVEGMDEAAAVRLAGHLLAERRRSGAAAGEAAAEALLAGSIARESLGSPFFITELVEHAVADAGSLAAAAASPSGGGTPGDGRPAARLDRLIVARLDRLAAPTRRLLEVVALAGRPLELETAFEVAALADSAPALAALRSANLVRLRRAESLAAIEPYHDRIREAVAQSLPLPERAAWHRRLAEHLERGGRAEPETIASHWREAGEHGREAGLVAAAAERAMAALAFQRAAGLFARALALGPAGEEERRRLQVSLGDALAAAGRGREAADAFLAAAAGASAVQGLDLRRRAADQQLISGHVDQGLETARGVLASVGLAMPQTLGQTLLGLIFKRLRLKLRGLSYRERPAAEVPADLLLRIDACRSIFMGLAYVQPSLGMSFATSNLLASLEAGEPYRLSLALGTEATYSAFRGRRKSRHTARLVDEAGALAAKVELPHARGTALLAAGSAFYFEGRFEQSLDFLARADALLRERCAAVTWELDTVLFYRLRALRYLGRVAQIRSLVPATLKDAIERGDRYAEACLRSDGLWLCELTEDRPQEALAEIETARSTWSRPGFHLLHYNQFGARVDIANYQGDGERAWSAVEAVWPLLKQSQMLRVELAFVEAHRLRVRAAFAGAAAAGQAARPRLLAEAAKALDKIAARQLDWTAPFCRQGKAVLAAFRGEKKQAAELLEEAAAGFAAAAFELPAAIARRRRGELLGGSEGELLVAEADAFLAAQGIKNPSRFADAQLPGPFARTGG